MNLNAFELSLRFLVKPYYLEPHRHYHTWDHVEAMLDGYSHLYGEITEAEYLAILYHDAIYNPWASGNEEASVKLMYLHHRQFFPTRTGAAQLLDSAYRIILDTRHKDPPGPASLRVVDLDLLILAKPAHYYDKYVAGIRRENLGYSDEEWRTGRTSFLESMLARPHIFVTPEAQLSEPTARFNIARELLSLVSK